jgi:hypothetical protein
VDVHIRETGQKIFTRASHDDAVDWPMLLRLMLIHASDDAILDENVPMGKGLHFVHWNYGYVLEYQRIVRLTKTGLGTEERGDHERD